MIVDPVIAAAGVADLSLEGSVLLAQYIPRPILFLSFPFVLWSIGYLAFLIFFYRDPLRRQQTDALGVLVLFARWATMGCLLLVPMCFLLVPYYVMDWYGLGLPETTTDITQYASIREAWSSCGLADHFPETIPEESTRTRMSFFPGFLQGGTSFQLALTLPAEDVGLIEAKYAKTATHRFRGGDTNDHANQPNGVPTTFNYTGGSDKFPSSFAVYVLKAVPRGEPGHKWNHGSTYGLCISKSSGEIVFWSECW